jgi:hypothetical protein
MNFEPASEHAILRDSVREFLDRELPEARIREMDRARRIPRELWKRFAAMGWQGLSVPTEYGGSGADVSTGAVFCEELARRFPSLATDWLLVSMTARVLRESGTPAQKKELLPRLAAGEFLMSFGMSEPGGGTDVLALKTRATLQGNEWVVRGQKLYTSFADDADAILVLCRTDPAEGAKRARGLSLVLTRAHPAVVRWRCRPGSKSVTGDFSRPRRGSRAGARSHRRRLDPIRRDNSNRPERRRAVGRGRLNASMQSKGPSAGGRPGCGCECQRVEVLPTTRGRSQPPAARKRLRLRVAFLPRAPELPR